MKKNTSINIRRNLTSIVQWSHVAIAEVMESGDLAVDLTAGNGNDTLFLARMVGPTGTVVAFDIQPHALENARTLLEGAGVKTSLCLEGVQPGPPGPGVRLIEADHGQWSWWVEGQPKVIMANLGYLPGGQRSVATNSASTLAALGQGIERLASGGRMAIVCYVAHEGGDKEAKGVEELLVALPQKQWRILNIRSLNSAGNANTDQGPFLLVAERK